MSDEITVTSTTDTQEAVDAAAGVVKEPEPLEQVETPDAPEPEADPETSDGEEEQESPETEPAPDTGTPEKKPQGKNRFSKRIDELTKKANIAMQERYEARQEAEELRQKLARIESGSKPPEPVAPQPTGDKPQRSTFTSDEEWVDAVSAYNVQKALAARDAQQEQETRREHDLRIISSYKQRSSEFAEQHPDFNQVVDISLAKPIGAAVEAAIQGRENGPEVAYYIGQNREIQDRLNSMNAVEAVAEIGYLSASLMPNRSSLRPATRLPEPITPVGGSTRVARSLSDIEDTDSWIAKRRAERQAVGRRR